MTSAADRLQIRPISPEDRDELLAGFEKFSEESRYARFLGPRTRLSEVELRYFTEVDHHDHEALVAVDPGTGEGVGVARFVRTHEDPEIAEMAVAVADRWQGSGVGSRLVAALADRARAEGVRSFSALALAENRSMLKLLGELGRVRRLQSHPGTVELVVDLPERGLGRLKQALAAAARGEIRAFPAFLRPGGKLKR
jgi:GNAT superfamily N-acetyltransferase